MRQRHYTFDEMVVRSASLTAAAADAHSFAKNARIDWYPSWLPRSDVMRDILREAAWELGLDAALIRTTIVDGLIREYTDARRATTVQPVASPCKPRGWRAPKQLVAVEVEADETGADPLFERSRKRAQ